MTNFAAAALIFIPILSFLGFVGYIYATCSQNNVSNEQRNDYKKQYKDEI